MQIPFTNIVDNYLQVSKWLDQQEILMSDDDFEKLLSDIKSKVQREAALAWFPSKNGAIVAATGVGKSKIVIDICIELFQKFPDCKVLLVVPTEKLRDNNWKEEFNKWNALEEYNKIKRVCYASLHKIKNNDIMFVIYDEGHRLTASSIKFKEKNRIKAQLLLTATWPKNPEKQTILAQFNIQPVFTCNLHKAQKLKLVAPYKLTIIETSLDNHIKYIESGGKDKKFFVTEKQYSNHLTKKLKNALSKKSKQIYNYRVRDRMHFLYNLKSKQLACRYIMDNILPVNKKYLIFVGNTKIANELHPYRYHSKNKRYNKKHFEMFQKGEITKLVAVNALNEGINIENGIDGELISTFNSTDRDITQRIGRAIRYRKNFVADILLLLCIDTQEEQWLNEALLDFDEANIERISYSDFILNN